MNNASEATWQTDVYARIASVEEAYHAWKRETHTAGLDQSASDDDYLRRIASAPKDSLFKIAELSLEINWGLFGIWEATGHCLFGDIGEKDFGSETLTITARYRAFLLAHESESLPEVVHAAFEHNVELLHTEYCWAALEVIQRYVAFEDAIGSAGKLHNVYVDAEARREIHTAMKNWFSKYGDSLVWCTYRRQFYPRGMPSGTKLPVQPNVLHR